MAVKQIETVSYEWTCDGCRTQLTSQTEKLPLNWEKVKANWGGYEKPIDLCHNCYKNKDSVLAKFEQENPDGSQEFGVVE